MFVIMYDILERMYRECQIWKNYNNTGGGQESKESKNKTRFWTFKSPLQ